MVTDLSDIMRILGQIEGKIDAVREQQDDTKIAVSLFKGETDAWYKTLSTNIDKHIDDDNRYKYALSGILGVIGVIWTTIVFFKDQIMKAIT